MNAEQIEELEKYLLIKGIASIEIFGNTNLQELSLEDAKLMVDKEHNADNHLKDLYDSGLLK